jgi:hypothetical protein
VIYRDQLQAVYALIERPEAWIQQRYAADSDGAPVPEDSPKAKRWCLHGACIRVGIVDDYDKKADALGLGRNASIAGFNDAPERTHAEVLALLRSAIDRAPVREAVS